ncbi:reverse transcriptase domain-containing protein [Tanacetum coccineum]
MELPRRTYWSRTVAHAITWTNLKKMMTDKYCPRGEIKKLEGELWNLKMKGTDVRGYSQRFQELALLCVRMFPEESDKVERYVGGLPDMIHGSVVASKPKTIQEAIEMANELIDKRINTIAERQADNKRKFDDTSKNNQHQSSKRQDVAQAYTVGSSNKKPYGGTKPLCPKCNYHHEGPCAPKCYKCDRVGHLARDCKRPAYIANNQRGTETGQRATCYECGAERHFKKDCPRLKNNNRGNRARDGNAPAKVYMVGTAGTDPDSNVVTGRYWSVLRRSSVYLLELNPYCSWMTEIGKNQRTRSLTKPSSMRQKIRNILQRGCQVFLALITHKGGEAVGGEELPGRCHPIVRSFSRENGRVFHPPMPNKWNFNTCLIPGAAPVATAHLSSIGLLSEIISIVGSTAKNFLDNGFIRPSFLTLGRLRSCCSRRRMVHSLNMHYYRELNNLTVKNSYRSKDCRMIYPSTSRVECLLEDRPEIGLSPIESS